MQLQMLQLQSLLGRGQKIVGQNHESQTDRRGKEQQATKWNREMELNTQGKLNKTQVIHMRTTQEITEATSCAAHSLSEHTHRAWERLQQCSEHIPEFRLFLFLRGCNSEGDDDDYNLNLQRLSRTSDPLQDEP